MQGLEGREQRDRTSVERLDPYTPIQASFESCDTSSEGEAPRLISSQVPTCTGHTKAWK